LTALACFSLRASAQEVLPVGNFPTIENRAPSAYAVSGMEAFRITRSDGRMTPIMRTQLYDARTVEILSRAQTPPIRSSDVHVMSQNGRQLIVVRRYLLLEVKPQDAAAEQMSPSSVAAKWASALRTLLPKIAPMPNRLGV
jgi:hypothetical protein